MTKTKTIICAALAAMVILFSLSGAAYGITGNYTPNSSPYVGVVVLFSDETRTTPISYCSGILISSTVMLTAGHATVKAAAASVCFDKGPISYTIENGKLVYSTNEKIYAGTPLTYPEYEQSVLANNQAGNHLFDNSDIGIIIFKDPITEVTEYAALPKVGFVDTLTSQSTLEVIGYGMQTQVTPKNNGPVNSWVGTLSCNQAQTQLVSGHFSGSDKYLKLTANPSQANGGIAFGDSGGPVVYNIDAQGSVVVALNAYVSNTNCAGVTYHTRLDVQEVSDWIQSLLG